MILQNVTNSSCLPVDRLGYLALAKKISARKSLLIGNLLLKCVLPFCIILMIFVGGVL